ncbi:glutamate--cysteine ligase [Streptomyces sp. NPDC046939]|uniref:carboxylate-amine ligase n=1 Tax=Streptomyces sp. NPDC046939 TaxID=3155376 RepID=UPI0033E7BEC0
MLREPERGLTVGVEEEFLLVDLETRRPTARSEPVVAAGRRRFGTAHVQSELSQAMVETAGSPCSDGRELAQEIRRLRTGAAHEAARQNCLLIATGTAPLGAAGPATHGEVDGPPPLLDTPRYRHIAARYGPLLRDQAVCACHVHVGVPDPAEAVQVVNHLRPWLPLLLALSANSPYWHGTDTGYSSWRTALWSRWPAAGPPPYLESVAHYEDTVAALVASKAILDPGMLYWQVRPSRTVPTVEVRIADVLPTAEEATAYALVVRGLVRCALERVRRGERAPRVAQHLLTAATWQAAREGAHGTLLDLSVVAPAVTSVRRQTECLRRLIGPHLTTADDRTVVAAWLDRLHREGSGAERQRATHRRAGSLESVVDLLAVPVDHTSTGAAHTTDRPSLCPYSSLARRTR